MSLSTRYYNTIHTNQRKISAANTKSREFDLKKSARNYLEEYSSTPKKHSYDENVLSRRKTTYKHESKNQWNFEPDKQDWCISNDIYSSPLTESIMDAERLKKRTRELRLSSHARLRVSSPSNVEPCLSRKHSFQDPSIVYGDNLWTKRAALVGFGKTRKKSIENSSPHNVHLTQNELEDTRFCVWQSKEMNSQEHESESYSDSSSTETEQISTASRESFDESSEFESQEINEEQNHFDDLHKHSRTTPVDNEVYVNRRDDKFDSNIQQSSSYVSESSDSQELMRRRIERHINKASRGRSRRALSSDNTSLSNSARFQSFKRRRAMKHRAKRMENSIQHHRDGVWPPSKAATISMMLLIAMALIALGEWSRTLRIILT